MHSLTLLYTKLSCLSNDRSVYLNLFDNVRFFAGKYEDFCLRKIERIVYVLVVITLISVVPHYIQGKPYYAYLSGFRCIFIILHCWWCFSHNLDMVEIEKWQIRDTSLNVQSSFAPTRISTSNFGIFKD